MDSMWDLFRALPLDIKGAVSLPVQPCYEGFALPSRKKDKFEASSSRATFEDVPRQSMPRKINDYVYEVCSAPAGKRPSVELIFFHGLQFKGSHETHLTTWGSANESESWLTWILEDIPDARILVISYDAHTESDAKQGNMDMYVTTENLLECLIGGKASVGQDGCPVVMVGHCIGGLVMKQLCVYAAEKLGLQSNKPDDRMQTFLNNVKGLFFYASPNLGTRLADLTKKKGALFQDATTLNTTASRRISEFSKLCQDKGWRTFGIGEAHEVTLGSFTGLVVPEASARCDVDGFYTVGADHFNVCRPVSKTSSNFTLLLSFILGVVIQDQCRQAPKIALEEAIGLEELVQDVLQKLKGGERVGIVGMGGIGKTTLAESVYDTISEIFEYTCFLQSLKLQFPNKRAHKLELREKIIGSLFHKGRKVDKDKQDFLWGHLKGKKVLLVLDDVDHESQVMVMTKEDGFSDDSRVIVTSRNQESFLTRGGFQIFSLKILNLEDSKRLFCFHAFNQTTPANGYDDRVAKFTKKCGGLPLALKVAGRFLYNRSPKLWDEAFSMLEKGDPLDGEADNELSAILSSSFNSLAKQEREMFLDIAKCFHGEKLDDVKEVWRTCGWAADVGWTNLLEKGLVTETKIWNGALIEMHEMLRDLGCSRACPRSQNISGHSRVCHFASENEGRIWPFSNEEIPKAEVLKIQMDPEEDRPFCRLEIDLDLDELRKLEKLRVLWFTGGNLYGDCHLFPKELVYVWIRYIRYWNDTYRPAEEQNRTLLYLKLEGCGFKTLPRSLGQLRALQSLTIEHCSELKTLPPCIGQLDALEYLTIRDCGNISLPNTPWQLKSLKHLVIVKYRSLGILGAVIGQMRALEYLEISQPQFSILYRPETEPVSCPNTLGQLEALKHLYLGTQYFVEDFQKNIVKLRRFEYLKLSPSTSKGPYWLPDSPIGLGQLQALKSLILDNITSNNLEDLPASLEYLEISVDGDRGYLPAVNLPSTIGGLHTLKRLEVRNLSVFPDSLCELQSLEYLHITSEVIDLLPDTLGNLRGLKHLTLSCSKLKALPDSIGELQALEDLTLQKWNRDSLETLPDTIGELRALKSFTVMAEGLKFLPNTIGGLKVLETLSLGCESLEALPDALGLLPTLRELRLEGCSKILALPHTVGHLQSLRTLVIRYCEDLKTLTDILSKLKYLEWLQIEYCPSLEGLQESLYSSIKYHKVTYNGWSEWDDEESEKEYEECEEDEESEREDEESKWDAEESKWEDELASLWPMWEDEEGKW